MFSTQPSRLLYLEMKFRQNETANAEFFDKQKIYFSLNTVHRVGSQFDIKKCNMRMFLPITFCVIKSSTRTQFDLCYQQQHSDLCWAASLS